MKVSFSSIIRMVRLAYRMKNFIPPFHYLHPDSPGTRHPGNSPAAPNFPCDLELLYQIIAGIPLGSSEAGGKNRWSALVTVTVHDTGHATLANATVTGNWSNGASGSSSCTTGGNGTCTLTKSGIRNNTGSVTLTVTDVSGGSVVYDPAGNDIPSGSLDVSSP